MNGYLKRISSDMTLDEAIEHCEEKAKGCDSCSKEHKQLADWLRELKVFRKIFKTDKKNNLTIINQFTV